MRAAACLGLVPLLLAACAHQAPAPVPPAAADRPRPMVRTPKQVFTLLEKSPRLYGFTLQDEDHDQWRLENLRDFWPPLVPALNVAGVEVRGGRRRGVELPEPPEVSQALQDLEALFERKDFPALEARYAALAARFPTTYRVQLYWGDVALFDRRPADALPRYERAAALAPYDYRAAFFRGNALLSLGRAEEARAAYTRALALRPHQETLAQAAELNAADLGARFVELPFLPGARVVATAKGADVVAAKGAHWTAWGACKAMWRLEPEARLEATGSAEHLPSTAEERECLLQLLVVWAAKRTDEPSLEFLHRVNQAHLLDIFILHELLTRQAPDLLLELDDAGLAEVERYVRTFVLVPLAPAAP